ncbi:hypothetical protein MY1884_005859 [Beauveria asiatica]
MPSPPQHISSILILILVMHVRLDFSVSAYRIRSPLSNQAGGDAFSHLEQYGPLPILSVSSKYRSGQL